MDEKPCFLPNSQLAFAGTMHCSRTSRCSVLESANDRKKSCTAKLMKPVFILHSDGLEPRHPGVPASVECCLRSPAVLQTAFHGCRAMLLKLRPPPGFSEISPA